MSVEQGQMNSGGAMLSWNLSAPCRLEGEVWPCHRAAGVEKDMCKEMKGLRQQLSNSTWTQSSKGRWVKESTLKYEINNNEPNSKAVIFPSPGTPHVLNHLFMHFIYSMELTSISSSGATRGIPVTRHFSILIYFILFFIQ